MHLDRPPLPDYLQFYMEMYIGKTPTWTFPDFPPSENLTYHRLDFQNYHLLPEIFKDDPHPFIDSRFKDADAAYEYVANLMICSQFLRKRGGADWLLQHENGDWVGVLHCYDLSMETIAYNNRKCSIGYAINEKYRGTGLAYEAVQQLHQYLFQEFNLLYVLAYPDAKNAQSIRFLEKLNYIDCTEWYSDEHTRFFHFYRSKKAHGMVEKEERKWAEKQEKSA